MGRLISGSSAAVKMPACPASGKQASPSSLIAASRIGERELLAKLVYAEVMSTGFGDDFLVYASITWGVMNRVWLGEMSGTMRRAYGRASGA